MNNALVLLRSQTALFRGMDPALGLDEYQQFTNRTDKNERPGADGIPFALLGLYGETGSLLSELKKKQRDKDSYIAYHDSVLEEFGDVLWYFANTALRSGLKLSVLAHRVSATLELWPTHGRPDATTFIELQNPKKSLAGPLSGQPVEGRLIAVAGKVGLLLEDFSSGKISSNGDVLSADLLEIFRAIIAAADHAEVSLAEAAHRNILKVLSRWPLIKNWGSLYDEDCDDDERLPRKIEVIFKEKDIEGKKHVLQQCNGIHIGDRLTDNRTEQDDYRFHDVFHLAYAAILGWSPVTRALFKLKRKSKPQIDENEDGARAVLIEEGISTWIFNHAARLHHFRRVQSIDYSLLKAIREFVKGYEVESRPLWQWEHAILEGYRVFRELQVHRGGKVIADLGAHIITFRTSNEGEKT
jgi:NTP pyrophosphatase (non-canonical NTP hydrolase)